MDARFVTVFLLINVDVRRRGYASCFKKKNNENSERHFKLFEGELGKFKLNYAQ